MKSFARPVLAFFFLQSILFSPVFAQADVGSQAPDFTLTDIEGQNFSLSEFRGDTVILTFVASRSVICRWQVETLVNISRGFGENVIFVLIGVNGEEFSIGGDTDTDLQELRKMYDFTGIVAGDTDNVAQKYDVLFIPTTFIIDYDGNVRRKHVGALDTRESALLQELPTIIPELPSTSTLLVALILGALAAAICARQARKHPRQKLPMLETQMET
jgi:peroxiredoxin